MLLRRFTLRARFVLAMVITTVSLSILGAWGVIANQVGIQKVASLFEQSNAANEAVAQLRESIGQLRLMQANIIAAGSNVNEVERLHSLWKQAAVSIDARGKALIAATAGDGDIESLVKAQNVHLADYVAAVGPIIEKLQGAQLDGPVALAYAEREQDKVEALVKGSDVLLAATQAAQVKYRDSLARSATLVSYLRLAVVAATLLVVLPLLWFTWTSVRDPLFDAVRLAGRIAEGDLSSPVDAQGRDEPAALLRSLAQMQSALSELVARVRDSAESIQTASREVAMGNQDLSQRTEQAAANLQTAASSIEQLHGAVTQSASTATQANQLAGGASSVATRGGEVVAQVVSTMDGINQGSRRIADIIGAIDGIAFQTG
jgi:methyl-accepting chemotaxis protein